MGIEIVVLGSRSQEDANPQFQSPNFIWSKANGRKPNPHPEHTMSASLEDVVAFFVDGLKSEGLIKEDVTATLVDTDGLPEFIYINLSNGEAIRLDITLPA
jgi:hypothetical protein